jgi:prevent-host-death family protein
MGEATVRELRNHGGAVLDRVVAGERITVTRDGRPVAELRPLPRTVIDAATLVARFAHLPRLDSDRFRSDLDAVIDQSL